MSRILEGGQQHQMINDSTALSNFNHYSSAMAIGYRGEINHIVIYSIGRVKSYTWRVVGDHSEVTMYLCTNGDPNGDVQTVIGVFKQIMR